MTKDILVKSTDLVEMKGIDVENRTIDFIGTTATKDRMGDVVSMDGWDLKNFMANPVFLWAHDGRAVPPIGRAKEVNRTAQGLRFKIEFVPKEIHPFADTIFKLYQAGFLKGVSVGFIPKKRDIMLGDNGEFLGFRFLEQELIELSAVSIPANPEALIQEAVNGVLQKEAAEFLTKSLLAERTFIDTVQDLKKEILLMDVKEENEEGSEITVDKRLENIENRLNQLENYQEARKGAIEVFEVVKTLLEGLKVKTASDTATNPFLHILAPGNEPKGTPEDLKVLTDAIGRATQRLASWTPKSNT